MDKEDSVDNVDKVDKVDSVDSVGGQNQTTAGPFNWGLLFQLTETDKPYTVLGTQHETREEFERDLATRIWISYRFGFEPILKAQDGPTPLSFAQSLLFSRNLMLKKFLDIKNIMDNESFTNDVGWGCMIRTSQSLLANAYLLVGRDPNEVIRLFGDNEHAPFSLHNFIKVASNLPLKVKPGQWFGPNAASLLIKRLCDKYESGLKVLISESSDVYDNAIADALNSKVSGILILLPIRLGIDKVNSIYYSSLLHLLSVKQSVGIAGGRPSSSFYFLGFQENDLIYLDPHYPQEYQVEPNYDTYHTLNFQKLNINQVDPSMVVGILITSIDDYDDFKQSCIGNENRIVHFHSRENALLDAPSSSEDVVSISSLLDYIDMKEEVPNISENYEQIDVPEKELEEPELVQDPELLQEPELVQKPDLEQKKEPDHKPDQDLDQDLEQESVPTHEPSSTP